MFLVPDAAHAETIDQLKAAYADALRGYEVALDEQDENAEESYSTDQEIKETELALIDGKECLKRRVTLENGSADLWLNEDEGKPVLLEIEGGDVKMTLRFSENNTGEIPYTETADLSE